MSTVSISLQANTASYVQRIKNAKTETDRNLILMEKRIDQFAKDVNNNFTSVNGSINAMLSGLGRMKGGGYVAAVLALSVAMVSLASGIHQVSKASLEGQREIERYAEKAKMSSDEFRTFANTLSTVGLSMEQVGDIAKDMQDKLGDYITNGSGGFEDFFQIVGFTEEKLKKMQSMNAEQLILYMADAMEKAGAKGAQMNNALESVGNDLSYALPLIKDNAKAYNEMREAMEKVSKTTVLNKDVVEEMQILEKNWETMWNNFGVVAGNKLGGLYDALNSLILKANELLIKIDIEDRSGEIREKIYKNFNLGQEAYVIDASMSDDQIQKDLKAAKHLAEALNSEVKTLEDKLAKGKGSFDGSDPRRLKDAKKALDLINEQVEAGEKLIKSRQDALKIEYGDSKTAAYTDKKIKEQEALIAGMQDRTLEQALAKAKAEHELKINQIKSETQTSQKVKDAAIEAEKAKYEELGITIREAYQHKQDKAKLDSIDTTTEAGKLEAQELAGKMAMDALNQRIRDEAIADDTAKKMREEAERKHQRELLKIRQSAEIERLQLAVDSAVTAEDKQAATFALTKARIEHEAALSVEAEKSKGGAIFNAKLENHMAQFDLETQFRNQNAFLEAERAQSELEFLKSQYNDKAISHEEYLERKRIADEAYNNAKRSIEIQALGIMESSFASIAAMQDEESDARRNMLIAEKAAAVASLSIQQWDAWGKAGSWGEKAMVIASYTGALASLASTPIGQFHSGTDEVDATGSYILKAGERVVQESANKDLTAYLNSNKRGGASGATINAPLNIQGDTTISESKLLSMMAKQRSEIAKLTKLAQKENPNLR
ncbi:hypothetical protein Q9X96_003096 [Vibrio vulnificus]|nr:hypothetical protein [Vibrio vulnificus]